MENLKGRLAFITRGSRGMGAAIAKRLSKEGANILFTHSGTNQKKADEVLQAIKSNGNGGLAIIADNEDPEAVLNAMNTAMKEFGGIDILVNNAGAFSLKSIEAYSLEEYDQMMNVNVKAVFVASQFAAQHMRKEGRIITIGSNMADRVTFPGGSLYSMSKSALIGLTKGLARDLGDRNITVNLIQPGPINTDMNPADSAHAPSLVASMAIKRFGTVEEVAGLVSYLSGKDSGFITGTTITIDGGYNI